MGTYLHCQEKKRRWGQFPVTPFIVHVDSVGPTLPIIPSLANFRLADNPVTMRQNRQPGVFVED